MKLVLMKKLTIYTTEGARTDDGHCLYEAVLRKARELNLAGVTVYRGLAGYGKERHSHTSRLVELSGDLPLVIVIIDAEKAALDAAALFQPWVRHGILTLEDVQMVSGERDGS